MSTVVTTSAAASVVAALRRTREAPTASSDIVIASVSLTSDGLRIRGGIRREKAYGAAVTEFIAVARRVAASVPAGGPSETNAARPSAATTIPQVKSSAEVRRRSRIGDFVARAMTAQITRTADSIAWVT